MARNRPEERPPGDDNSGPGTLPASVSGSPPPGPDDLAELSEAEAQEYSETLDEKLKGWVAASRYENTQATCTLYKFDNPATGEDKSQCGQWVDEIPDAHSVGMTYGPGRYLLLVTLPRTRTGDRPGPRAIKGYRFRIHPYYEELRRRAMWGDPSPFSGPGPRPHVPGAMAPPPGPDASISAGLSMVREVLAIVSPLLKRQDNGGGLDYPALMMRNYDLMNTVMRKNLLESQSLIADGLRAKMEGGAMDGGEGGTATVEEAAEPSILEQIIPLLDKFVPIILGRGPQAVVASQAVRALPQFQKVTKDKGEFQKIVAHLDKAIGKGKVDGLLKRLKLSRPGDGGEG